MDWTINLESITKIPVTVEEAVNSLIIVLDNEHKRTIALMKEDDLVDLHFSLGAEIRNVFDLHDLGEKLIADCGTSHPDDASMVIINALWKKLTQE